MPVYRLVLQKNVAPDARTRAARATVLDDVESVTVMAPSLAYAVMKYCVQHASPEPPPRLVSVEELYELDPSALSDAAIESVLRSSPNPVAVDDYEGIVISQDNLVSHIRDVAEALRGSETLPGLTLTVDDEDYVMVEIHDQATGTYRSVGRQAEHLIGGSSMTGKEGLISIARSLVETVASSQLL